MKTESQITEIEVLKNAISLRHDRIKRLQQLRKLKGNKPLMEEIDEIVKISEGTIYTTLGSKEIPDANKEQVLLRTNARVRLIMKGFKGNIESSQVAIDRLNDEITKCNEKIKKANKEAKNEQIV